MYITNTTESVRKLVGELQVKEDISKLKFLIYIIGLLNNNQMNDKNEANFNLVEDENIKVLTYDQLDLSVNSGMTFLQHLTMIYNTIIEDEKAYEDDGNVIGIKYNTEEKQIISEYENLEFEEKLDVLSEIIIKCDNGTYFSKNIINMIFDTNLNGFDLAKKIQNFKN